MTRLNIPLSFLAVVLLVAGCGSSKTAPTDGEAANKPDGTTAAEAGGEATESIGTLTGPGGSVSLGDAPEKFEAAFPRPEGATDPQNPPVEGTTWFGWQTDKEVVSAAVEDGRITLMFQQLLTADSPWADDSRKKYGKPTHDVTNSLGTFVHWSADGREHAVMLQAGATPGAMQMTGESTMLAKMGFDASQMAAQLQAAGEAAAAGEGAAGGQGHSPDDGHGH